VARERDDDTSAAGSELWPTARRKNGEVAFASDREAIAALEKLHEVLARDEALVAARVPLPAEGGGDLAGREIPRPAAHVAHHQNEHHVDVVPGCGGGGCPAASFIFVHQEVEGHEPGGAGEPPVGVEDDAPGVAADVDQGRLGATAVGQLRGLRVGADGHREHLLVARWRRHGRRRRHGRSSAKRRGRAQA